MKAKELLKTLCKSGLVDGSIYTGKSIIDANYKVLEGKVFPNKEYFYSFKELTLVHTAMIKTNQGSIVYLYSIWLCNCI